MPALAPEQRSQAEKEKPAGVAMLPCQQAVSNKISRLPSKHNMKTIHMVRTTRVKLRLKVAGIHCIPCEFGKVYVGQRTEPMIDNTCKEHMRHLRLGQPEESAVAERKFESGHNIAFGNTTILGEVPGYMDCLIMEAIEVRLHPRHFNRNGGLKPPSSKTPFQDTLKYGKNKNMIMGLNGTGNQD
jgi:hypothetical protein